MSSSNLSFCKILPLAVFKQLEQQVAQVVGAVILTESRVGFDACSECAFTVLISPQFSALLMGATQDVAPLEVQLAFVRDAIAQFLTKLDILLHNLDPQQTLVNYRQILQPHNDARNQSQLTLLLLSILT